MTVKEKCLMFLIENGMFPAQAEAVFQQALPHLVPPEYRMIWEQPAEEYPQIIYAGWSIILTHYALIWIDTNLPQAWFRPMFTKDPAAEIARLRAMSEKQ